MRVTRDWLMQHRSERGGWNFSQLALLGESWPPTKGWIERAIDREISDERAALFVEYSKRRPSKNERQSVKRMVGLLPPKVENPNKRGPTPKMDRREQRVAPEAKLSFLQTYEWRRVRMQALKRYGLRCQCCGATPDHGVRMHVDHIKPRRLFPELALDINNLQVLCEECNHGKGNWDMTDWRARDEAAN